MTTPTAKSDPAATIDVTEGADPTLWKLTPPQVEAVRQCGLVTISPARQGSDGMWSIKAKRTVGAVRLGTGADRVQLRIAPKVPVDRLLHLLAHAGAQRARWKHDPVDAAVREGLFPAVAYCFARAAEHALRPGVLQGYRYTEATSIALRGRLRESAQVRRRPGQALPLEIGYHERSVDIPENQRLRAAARHLARLPFDLGPALRSRLKRLDGRLEGATLHPGTTRLPAWNPNRLNTRYIPALRLADVILEGSSFEYDHGQGRRRIRVDGLLVNMEKVYEDFVVSTLGAVFTRHLGGHTQAHPNTHFLDDLGHHPLYPDLVHQLPDHQGVLAPAVIVDAKYQDTVEAANLYQMLAYCTRFGLSEGHLVVVGRADGTPVRIPRPGGALLIHRHALDLALPPAELTHRIQELGKNILDLRGPSR